MISMMSDTAVCSFATGTTRERHMLTITVSAMVPSGASRRHVPGQSMILADGGQLAGQRQLPFSLVVEVNRSGLRFRWPRCAH